MIPDIRRERDEGLWCFFRSNPLPMDVGGGSLNPLLTAGQDRLSSSVLSPLQKVQFQVANENLKIVDAQFNI